MVGFVLIGLCALYDDLEDDKTEIDIEEVVGIVFLISIAMAAIFLIKYALCRSKKIDLQKSSVYSAISNLAIFAWISGALIYLTIDLEDNFACAVIAIISGICLVIY